jgi:quercetin dioxygenase-like cupin family protein
MEIKSFILSEKNRLERTRHYLGGYWIFLATGKETDNQFATMETNYKKGLVPPPHTHTKEDETWQVLEGEVTFTVGEVTQTLRPGDFIFLPKNIQHSFVLESDTAKMLLQVFPAGLEEFFMELSVPADKIDYPPLPSGPPSAEWLARISALQQKYGILGIDNTRIKVS